MIEQKVGKPHLKLVMGVMLKTAWEDQVTHIKMDQPYSAANWTV